MSPPADKEAFEIRVWRYIAGFCFGVAIGLIIVAIVIATVWLPSGP